MTWVYDDGGRKAAGYSEKRGDCVTRAIAIATVCLIRLSSMVEGRSREGEARLSGIRESREEGVHQTQILCEPWCEAGRLGGILDKWGGSLCPAWQWNWVQGASEKSELPKGRLIIRCSLHLTAVIDG